MTSKDEEKREYEEMEGDPLIKSKRRQLHPRFDRAGGGRFALGSGFAQILNLGQWFFLKKDEAQTLWAVMS